MRVLAKFTSKQKYANSFRRGKLHMNALSYFWNNGEGDQKDVLEGVIASISPQKIGFLPADFATCQLTDIRFQAVGYAYCNVFCMSRFDIIPLTTLPGGTAVNITTPANMKDFGDYVVIVDDEAEYLRRIHAAAKNYQYLCGNVSYHNPTLNGTPMEQRPHILLKADATFDIRKIEGIKKKWDAFDKSSRYRGENEWRLCLYRGVTSTEPFELDIGDIRDITHMIKTRELEKEIYKLKTNPKFFQSTETYYGNVSRKDLRELFYELGDYRAWMFSTIG